MDAAELIFALVLAVLINAIVLYFVIKAAVKNALSEDRVFQAKVRDARDARDASPGQPTR